MGVYVLKPMEVYLMMTNKERVKIFRVTILVITRYWLLRYWLYG